TRALALESEALGLLDEQRDSADVVDVLANIGEIRSSRGEFAEAMRAHGRALDIASASGYALGKGLALFQKGSAKKAMGDYGNARYETLGRRRDAAAALSNLGAFHDVLGEYPEALDSLSRALAATEALNDRRGVVLALVNIADVRVRSAEPAAAMPLLARAKS